MSKEERKVFKTDGKLRKGMRKADYRKGSKKPKARRNPAKKSCKNPKVSASKIKIAQTRKTAPGGWKSSLGPYVIVTTKGNMVKGCSFRDLNAAKTRLAALRTKGRKGLKLVKVSIPKKNPARKKAAPKRRPARKPARRRARRKPAKKAKTVSKSSLRAALKRLGV